MRRVRPPSPHCLLLLAAPIWGCTSFKGQSDEPSGFSATEHDGTGDTGGPGGTTDSPAGDTPSDPTVDADGDGVIGLADCDDTDPTVYPGAPEACNGRDDDCDEQVDEDADCGGGGSDGSDGSDGDAGGDSGTDSGGGSGSSSACDWTETEPNTASSAQVIPLGDTVCGTVDSASDEDWFAVTTTTAWATLDVQVDAAASGSTLDAHIELYDGSGVLIADLDDPTGCAGCDPTLSTHLPTAGMYFVRLADAGGTGSAGHTYALTMTEASAGCDLVEVEPNGGWASTVSVSSPTRVCGMVEGASDDDWVTLYLTAGTTLDVTASTDNATYGLDAELVVLDASGQVAASHDPSGEADPTLSYLVAEDGYYAVLVLAANSGARSWGPYLLDLHAR